MILVGDLKDFMKECRLLVITLLEKLFERGLTGSSFLKSVGCIDPTSISSTSKENLIKQMKQVLHHLLSYKYITSSDGDIALQQFTSLLDESSTTFIGSFKEFQKEKIRLDDFFFDTLKVGSTYKAFSKVLMLIFTLFHGQAAVERGFSINSAMLLPNMKELSLTSRRLVKDYLVSQHLKPHKVFIPTELIQSVRSSHLKYKIYLENKRKEREEKIEDTQLSLLNADISTLKDRKTVLQELWANYNKEFVERTKKAAEQTDFTKMRVYLTKGNDLKRKAEDNEDEISKIGETLSGLLVKRKKLGGK
jgi:hypothetical protein